jgi:tRNA A-37 threonylcarbamoyl transferase component Bud32
VEPRVESDHDSGGPLVLKERNGRRIEVVSGHRVVRKTYRIPRHVRWRTLGVRSKARREFENLRRLRRAGIPTIRPLDWSESRIRGCVTDCALETELIDAESLESWLLGSHDPAIRRRVTEKYGRLLRRLHDLGFFCLSFYPRNVLLDANFDLHVFDQPRLLAFSRSLVGTERALVDLYDAAFTQGRRRSLSSEERHRLVRSYCAGDGALCEGISRRLRARRRLTQRAAKLWLAGFGQLGAGKG